MSKCYPLQCSRRQPSAASNWPFLPHRLRGMSWPMWEWDPKLELWQRPLGWRLVRELLVRHLGLIRTVSFSSLSPHTLSSCHTWHSTHQQHALEQSEFRGPSVLFAMSENLKLTASKPNCHSW